MGEAMEADWRMQSVIEPSLRMHEINGNIRHWRPALIRGTGYVITLFDGNVVGLNATEALALVYGLNSAYQAARPYVVSDSKDVEADQECPTLGCFSTEQEAAEFISTLPEHETGRYNLDGPADG